MVKFLVSGKNVDKNFHLCNEEDDISHTYFTNITLSNVWRDVILIIQSEMKLSTLYYFIANF